MKRLFSLLLALVISLALIPVMTANIAAAQGDPMVIAAWNYGGGDGTNSMAANGGEARWSATVSCGVGTFSTSTGAMKTDKWSNEAQYIQFALCTKGFENITHSSMVRSSGTGPKYFKIQYSLDGENFTDCGTFTVSSSSLTLDIDGVSMPAAIANQDLVFVRWVLADKLNFNGTADVSAGGAFNFKGMNFSGTPTDESLTVIATPEGGDMALGDTVTLATSTEGATIYYRSYPPQSAEAPYTVYSSGIVLDTLPTAIQVYAEKDGVEGRIRLFEFTHYKVSSVNASRYSGAIEAGREITLETATEGATIKYDLTTKYGLEGETVLTNQTYTAPISFLEGDFPVHITAYAAKAGCIDSELLTLDYTLKAVGGEKFYFGQLHSHTNISDGAGTLREAYEYAINQAQDVDYLIVTDHSNYLDSSSSLGTMDGDNRGIALVEKNYVEGDPLYSEGITKWDYAKAVAASYTTENFVAAYGYEMTWSGQYGHMNTFATEGFASRNNPKYVVTGGQGLVDYYELLTQFPSSIGMFNHPGDTFGTFNDFSYYTEKYDAQIKMLEVGNGEGAVGGSMYWPSYEQYTRALDKGWHIAPSNSQDNHKGLWGDSNTCRTVIYTNDFTEAGLYAGIRDLRVIATEDSNCSALFTLNNELFGTVLDAKPESIHISVTITDPDTSDRSGKLSIIANNATVAASKSYVLVGGEATIEFDLDPLYDYYYARIDQSDGDICVTSPVWISDVSKVGVSSISADNDILIHGEESNFSITIYNDEATDFSIDTFGVGADYGTSGDEIYSTSNLSVPAGESLTINFASTPFASGNMSLIVTVEGHLGDKAITLSGQKDFSVFEADNVMVVAIDAAHDNYYVSGGYAGYYARLRDMVTLYNGRTKVISEPITSQTLSDVDLLVLSAPYVAAYNNGTQYTQAEIDAIGQYAQNGGSLLIAGKSSYGDSASTQTANTLNAIIAAAGSDTRLRQDDTRDPNSTGSYDYQLKYTTTDAYNLDNYIAAGVTDTSCTFVYHNGSSVAPGVNANAVVFGGANAYAYTADGNTATGSDVVYLTEETLMGGGKLFVTGCMFFNDYQLSNVSSADNQSGNYHTINNILRSCTNVKTIAQARQGNAGDFFMVRGTLVSNASGYSAETAFFDSVYIEDSTGGICLFPVSGHYQVGQQVWASGFVDSYQGDFELSEVRVYVDSNAVLSVKPHIATAAELNDVHNQGELLSVAGLVTDISFNGGRIEFITVEDRFGDTAIVFLDGYIGSDVAYSHNGIAVGSCIYAAGVATTGPVTGVADYTIRLRVRDAAEIALIGDATRNGSLDAADAARILRYIVKYETLTDLELLISDTNGDGDVTAADAANILRYIVHLIPMIG
ncbi:MAG: dockerin type I domain-containing protein [Eubacteriales bacterium]|nr:dockerin type I domain-containing protein [Eubacteriales bacterium]